MAQEGCGGASAQDPYLACQEHDSGGQREHAGAEDVERCAVDVRVDPLGPWPGAADLLRHQKALREAVESVRGGE